MPSPNTPDAMSNAVLRNLPEKTGRSLDEWIALLRGAAIDGFMKQADWLKQKHGIGHVTAWTIVEHASRPDDYVPPSDVDLIAAQYAGPKAALRPIFDRLAAEAVALGDDVTLGARKTYVSLMQPLQFGLIMPTTRTRVDLGLRLPDTPPTARLGAAGGWGSGCVTHRVRLTSLDDVDDELRVWLRQAYAARG